MEELISQFRALWNDFEWSIVKIVLLAFAVYIIAYQIGKFWANTNH